MLIAASLVVFALVDLSRAEVKSYYYPTDGTTCKDAAKLKEVTVTMTGTAKADGTYVGLYNIRNGITHTDAAKRNGVVPLNVYLSIKDTKAHMTDMIKKGDWKRPYTFFDHKGVVAAGKPYKIIIKYTVPAYKYDIYNDATFLTSYTPRPKSRVPSPHLTMEGDFTDGKIEVDAKC